MSLESLTVQQFRNIEKAELNFQNGLNLVFGENGSGKTSLLEAIHYLSAGKSFRTRNLSPLIHDGSSFFTIAGNISYLNTPHRIGIRRSRTQIIRRLDNQNINKQVEFSRLLPVRIMHPDSHLLISSSPGLRRRFLDWGCFYFDSSFYEHWFSIHTLLKQRNAVLREKPKQLNSFVSAIDQELVLHSNKIDSIRKSYLEALKPYISNLSVNLIKFCDNFSISYSRGWSEEKVLGEILKTSLHSDLRLKRTQHGPHRADFSLQMNHADVRNTASRGQQKLIAFVLVLAQLEHFEKSHDQTALLLVDDVASELDSDHQNRFLRIIKNLRHQVILTAISPELINLDGLETHQMFHVKHGTFVEMV